MTANREPVVQSVLGMPFDVTIASITCTFQKSPIKQMYTSSFHVMQSFRDPGAVRRVQFAHLRLRQ